ncbi:conjugal transfer protein TraG [Orientia tsutsugamushi]|nr:putative conjugative transfer protein TraG [Orientia tsutsugamushi str. TA763]KJV72047.1 putative conjugative transfer protein TraG [Orientia tsutsugamushi str. TA763]KJV75618.1 putative conjugative transfer protein TraG [Orientia tsutsugamushi str. TA763]SPP24003.1 conjugal transfer protein TraG [Orientia tsutsugamushi]
MKQAMLLNANRESYDDWREKFSLSRIYPNLAL